MKRFISLLVSLFFIIPLFAQLVFDYFTPDSGPIGTTVTIQGKGFSTTPANNVVYFGAVKASIVSSTDTVLVVTVP